jgi:enamine deaminase RidA (YjgF/YER057c/UK114 family)
MMSRFTERAQEALQRGQQNMFARQHKHLDVEHLFLALLQQRNSLPAEIISRLGGDAQMMVGRLESALDSMQRFVGGPGVTAGYITLRANHVLQGSVEEADRLEDSLVSTEHLFLAIAARRDGVAGRLLAEAEINDDNARATLLQIRGNPQTAGAGVIRHDIIQPQALVQPRGFSHGILSSGGRLLFLAGQTATDGEGKIVAPGDVVGQYRQVLSNLKAVVEEAGGKMTDIAKMTIFVRDRDDYKAHLKELGQAHREAFGTYYPATALLEISRFYDDEALVEIEAIAVLGGGSRWWGA